MKKTFFSLIISFLYVFKKLKRPQGKRDNQTLNTI